MTQDSVNINEKYFKLSSIVDTVLTIDLDLSVSHFFQKFLTAAKWYYIQLSVNHFQDAKTVLLDVSDVLTCTLPPDCIRPILVAEPYFQYARTLAVNTQLNKLDRTLGNPEFTFNGPPGQLPNGLDISNYGGYELVNYNNSSLFSFGGGLPSKGFYKLVEREGGVKELLLDYGVCTTQVYIEYITSGINPCGATICNPNTGEAVRKYLNHFWEKTRKDGGKTEAAIFRTGQELYHAEAIVKSTKNDLDPESILALQRRFFRLTPKA